MSCLLKGGLISSLQSSFRFCNQLNRSICTTGVLFAEPPKKRRRLDPALLRVRTEKRIKKNEREIEKLQKEPRQLIPILEYQPTNSTIRDWKARPERKHNFDFGKLRAAQKLWNYYRLEQSKKERLSINQIERAQTRALETLKQLDEKLYQRTVVVDDFTLIPYISSHMLKETPANPNYVPPDGHIKNVSKEWVM